MGVRRRTALVLDTDEAAMISLQRMLQDEGIDTTITWDQQEALALLRSKRYDVLLLAEHPPQLDSKYILQQIESTAPGLRRS